MNDSELENYFYITCYHYAKTIGPDPSITDEEDFVYLINNNDGNGITIAEWNHASTQPTNTVLKTYSVATVLNTWNTYIKNNTSVYKINENGSFDIDLIGPWASNKTITVKYVVVENLVSLTIPTISYAADANSNYIVSNQAIKVSLRPQYSLSFPLIVENDYNKQFGCFKIDSNGYLAVYADANKNNFYGNVGNAGFEAISVSYSI